MNLIVRGVAGILFITGIVMNRVLWKGMYMDGKAKLFLEVAGGNAGSIHAVSFVFPTWKSSCVLLLTPSFSFHSDL